MTTFIEKNKALYQNRIQQVAQLIGNTPLYKIERIFQKPGVEIYAKLEWNQLGGSVKSRPAFQIIKTAIERGDLGKDKILLDATSGNTGIAYASIGAALGVKVALCLPENASEERKQILQSLGAKLIYTSKFEGTDGAQLKAKELFREFPDKYFYADQYANEQNWKAHFETTGVEIWNQTEGKISHFIAGLGTTGTFMGTGKRLKSYNKEIELVALQPNNPMHGLEGWKHLETAIVPKIYDAKLVDRFMEADTLEAYGWIKLAAKKEGLLLSPSAAANLAGAIALAQEIEEGVIVTSFADNAEKYGEVMRQITKQ